jgi:hypothetical protein
MLTYIPEYYLLNTTFNSLDFPKFYQKHML